MEIGMVDYFDFGGGRGEQLRGRNLELRGTIMN